MWWEAGGLDRPRPGQAVHTHDPSIRRLNQTPFLFAGNGIGIDPAQVSLHRGVSRVLQQVLELLGEALDGAGGAFVVKPDRLPELLADPKQLGFHFALTRVCPEFRERDGANAQDSDQRKYDKEREPAL